MLATTVTRYVTDNELTGLLEHRSDGQIKVLPATVTLDVLIELRDACSAVIDAEQMRCVREVEQREKEMWKEGVPPASPPAWLAPPEAPPIPAKLDPDEHF